MILEQFLKYLPYLITFLLGFSLSIAQPSSKIEQKTQISTKVVEKIVVQEKIIEKIINKSVISAKKIEKKADGSIVISDFKGSLGVVSEKTKDLSLNIQKDTKTESKIETIIKEYKSKRFLVGVSYSNIHELMLSKFSHKQINILGSYRPFEKLPFFIFGEIGLDLHYSVGVQLEL